MDLTPNDIRNYEFPTQLRGYEKDAVDECMEQVAASLETAKQENLRLSMEIESLKSQLAGLKQFEDTIKNAAIDARRNADITMANARQEGESLLAQAKKEAENVLEIRSRQITDIEEKVAQLNLTKKSYMSKLKGLISSHLELVEEIAQSTPTRTDEDALDITDSAEVQAKTRETIATPPSRQEGIKTEEANAPGEIRPVMPDEEMEALAGQPPEEQTAEIEKAIDPELAAALESYKRSARLQPAEEEEPAVAPTPAPGAVVETTKRAEDIPNGFVAHGAEEKNKSTDKIGLAPEAQDQPTEHNVIDMDNSAPKEQPGAPDNIADDLDEVARKFEEEMDKAAKS
ncbi:MAG TPA: DivIVA domain-containing protein [Acidobacteriota bacterium]|nr:DivIVA domain-containing protein [Acidobacteriota bacterium]